MLRSGFLRGLRVRRRFAAFGCQFRGFLRLAGHGEEKGGQYEGGGDLLHTRFSGLGAVSFEIADSLPNKSRS